jgi:hypothetical protein
MAADWIEEFETHFLRADNDPRHIVVSLDLSKLEAIIETPDGCSVWGCGPHRLDLATPYDYIVKRWKAAHAASA